MTNITNAACVAANAPGLPDDTRRLIEIEDAIAKIRTQIATADLTRQRTAKPIEPDWGQAVVSRSKTGRGKVTAPIFLLVPQVKLPKRLDLARDAERVHGAVPGLIVANWVEARR